MLPPQPGETFDAGQMVPLSAYLHDRDSVAPSALRPQPGCPPPLGDQEALTSARSPGGALAPASWPRQCPGVHSEPVGTIRTRRTCKAASGDGVCGLANAGASGRHVSAVVSHVSMSPSWRQADEGSHIGPRLGASASIPSSSGWVPPHMLDSTVHQTGRRSLDGVAAQGRCMADGRYAAGVFTVDPSVAYSAGGRRVYPGQDRQPMSEPAPSQNVPDSGHSAYSDGALEKSLSYGSNSGVHIQSQLASTVTDELPLGPLVPLELPPVYQLSANLGKLPGRGTVDEGRSMEVRDSGRRGSQRRSLDSAAHTATAGLSLKDELAMLETAVTEGAVESTVPTPGSRGRKGQGAFSFPGPQACPGHNERDEGVLSHSQPQTPSQHQPQTPSQHQLQSPSQLQPQTPSQHQSQGTVKCREFSAAALAEATGNWDKKNALGTGQYGTVFQGRLSGCHVAVKRLESASKHSQKEYRAEVEVLSRVRHPNVLLLMGHCPESSSLVYEYMPRGSLQDFLGPNVKRPLTWAQRLQALQDVAAALLYLHQFSPPIVHRDLKPQNIMLDSSLRAKVGDAGLARLLAEEDDSITCRVSGTFGYIDPEMMVTLEVSAANDVYAYGMICLQMLTGENQVARLHKLINESTSAGAEKTAVQRTVDALVRNGDTAAGAWPEDVARQLARIGLRCASRKGRDRPSLEVDVVPALSGMLQLAATVGSDNSGCGSSDMEAQLRCPISKQRMTDPVLASDGFTYERRFIEAWQCSNDCSPVTGQQFLHRGLVPNNSLKVLLTKPRATCA